MNRRENAVWKTPPNCPEGRISSPTKMVGARQVVDVTTYIPYFFAAINNTLSRGASQLYLDKFGVGIVEWRVISMLGIEPKIPASRICDVIALDKGAVSRALNKLNESGHLDYSSSETDPRKKIWWLSKKGSELHDSILAMALERERRLIAGVDPDDLEAFLRVIRLMRLNVNSLGGDDTATEP